jgi:hypothetical protein
MSECAHPETRHEMAYAEGYIIHRYICVACNATVYEERED